MNNLATWVPLLIVVISFLIGLAYKQARPTINAFSTAFVWCFILAMLWLIWCLFGGGAAVRLN